LYGGAAGGGKTYAILLEALRYHKNPLARVTIFRRKMVDLKNQGGLWDESKKIFPHFGAIANNADFRWKFPSGAEVEFAHLNHEDDKRNYDGAQIPIILFDELTHFTETQFWYLFSRSRSDSGIRPYIRATCNPEPNWVLDMIEWYVDDAGYARADRACTVRYFIRQNDRLVWGDTPNNLSVRTGCDISDIKSFQFIPASLEDNKILMEKSGKEYVGSLKVAGEVESKRLLEGNWRVKKEGKIFKMEWFQIYTRLPIDIDYKIMTVDTAQKEKESNDYSVMQVWGRWNKKIYLIDQLRGKYNYPDLKLMFVSFLSKHRNGLHQIFIEDKVSGTALIQDLQRESPVPILSVQRNKDKYTRAYDCQNYVSSGFVFLNPLTDYYTDFISELISFSADGLHGHDDQADCMFDAIEKLLINPSKPIDRSNNSQYSNLMSIIV